MTKKKLLWLPAISDELTHPLNRLIDHCILFDQGRYHHVGSIAVEVSRIMETIKRPNSFAVNDPCFMSSLHIPARRVEFRNVKLVSGLVMFSVRTSMIGPTPFQNILRVAPKLETAKSERVTVDRWWYGKIMNPVNGISVRRWDLIKDYRDKQGGAHAFEYEPYKEVSELISALPELVGEYVDIIKSIHGDILSVVPNDIVSNVIPCIIRQIAHEMLMSLLPLFPDSVSYYCPVRLLHTPNYRELSKAYIDTEGVTVTFENIPIPLGGYIMPITIDGNVLFAKEDRDLFDIANMEAAKRQRSSPPIQKMPVLTTEWTPDE